MIIATAGHVDHGKTTLIRALTGVDTDRQAEEKRRGLSIDLGFAWADTDTTAPLGFVDVPGHERFLRNMLAGVAAVDFVLLVVAADDGPMPQTLEHLAILDLLGIRRGAVAITRSDRVTLARTEAVSAEIRDLLAPTSLREAPLFPVSGLSGAGVPGLMDNLRQAAATTVPRPTGGYFRLTIDRCFTVRGSGCVVTGTVLSGQLHTGEWMLLAPAGDSVRVRGIEVHGAAAPRVRAGERCAINLAGDLKTDAIRRGDWLVAPELATCSNRLDVSLRLLKKDDAPLPRGQIQLHLGAAVRNGRVVALGPADIGNGAMLAQVVVDAPVHSVWGDRVIVRDPAANRSLGGGSVVDPLAPRRGRSSAPRLALLLQLARAGSARGALWAMLASSSKGVELDPFARRCNLLPAELAEQLRAANVETLPLGTGPLGLRPAQVTGLCREILTAVAAWHDRYPDSLGPTEPELARLPGPRLAPELRHALVGRLLGQGELARTGFSVHQPEHRPRLSPPDQALLDQITALQREAGLRPPIVGDLALSLGLGLGLEKAKLLVFLERAHHLSLLVRVAPNRYFLPETLTRLARIAVELASESPRDRFDARQYRDRSGIGRNLTIQVLEYLDRAGVTAFIKEERRIQPSYTGPKFGKDLDQA